MKSTLKNIIKGIRSSIAIHPPRRDYSVGRSDVEALRQDWVKVGKDLSTAINKAKRENRSK